MLCIASSYSLRDHPTTAVGIDTVLVDYAAEMKYKCNVLLRCIHYQLFCSVSSGEIMIKFID